MVLQFYFNVTDGWENGPSKEKPGSLLIKTKQTYKKTCSNADN